ncbi:MAG: hypothetical protein HY271_00295 [Deltaproteobacteria bacterium]|nr:hypothetical protein [Deltaproteobacteria bacterium]
MLRLLLALLGLLALLVVDRASATDGNSLRLLMLSAQDMNTPQTLLRADVAIEVEGPQGKRTTDAIALFAPGKDARWYWQSREPALRALVLGSDRKVLEQHGATTDTVPIGAPLDALGIAYEDLSRFVVDDFKTWQITDESADKILVGMFSIVESAYVYRAYTFDKEKTVPTKIQFYAKTLSNLVKLRLDSDHILVGKKWMPTAIQIQNYPDNVITRFTLRWTQNATAPPELLAPASFPATSPLPWDLAPKATATAASK